MFTTISGFDASPIRLHDSGFDDSDKVTFAVVRWLSPHPNATLRDKQKRPVCSPPLEYNHALWQFSKVGRTRDSFYGRSLERQLHLFDGSNQDDRRENAMSHSLAFYGLVRLESIETFINVTPVPDDPNTFLETITLPFDQKSI